MREHRSGIAAWVAGGALAMICEAFALDKEMGEFPGGPQALAQVVMPAIEAMRPLRWPAERLDTLGGYLTFHNIVLFQAFLAIYGAVQGARAIRGPEERHALEQILAAGWSRTAYVRDRVLGFVCVCVLIAAGLGAGIAVSIAAVGQPNTQGSFINAFAIGLCILVAYALGLVVAEVTRSARIAAGLSSVVLFVVYVITNDWENLGFIGVIRFVSPFTWANMSRALVPGYGLHSGSILVLVCMSLVLVSLATVAFNARDYGAPLWQRATRRSTVRPAVATQRWWLRRPWSATIGIHRWGLLFWMLAVGAYSAFMMAMQPTVMDAWSMLGFVGDLMGEPSTDKTVLYTSFTADVAAPIVVAYVITQSAGWVADLHEGRVEALLAAPLSWAGLVVQRVLAACTGVVLITLAWLLSLIAASVLVGAPVQVSGVGRMAVLCVLIGWATAALASVAVVTLRQSIAVTLLAVYAGTAYLLTWLIPIFEWPEWVHRLTVFDAFGHPYQAWPGWPQLLVLVVLAIPGTALAAVVAERTPKVG